MFKSKVLLLIISLSVFLAACNFNSSNNYTSDPNNTGNDPTVTPKTPSIIGKWYYNSEDDRYYFNFKSDGSVTYQYYQHLSSSPTSNLNTFVTKSGRWSYLNTEKTKFAVGWEDSIDNWYNIVSEDDDKLIVSPDPNNNCGFGLYGITELLKKAKKVVYTVPDEIANLIGTWYYDESKDGNYITFQTDKKCYYHYYVNNGGAVSSLDGWHSLNGVWSYKSDSNTLGITMNGELAFSYDIIEFTSDRLLLRMSANNPSAQSVIYRNAYLYK